MKRQLVTSLMWIAALLAPAVARGQSVTVNLGAGAGTGLELGGPRTSTVHHSPTFVTAQVGLLFDNDQRFEVGGALLMEVEGRVGIAVEPELRIHKKAGARLDVYGLLGVPIYFAPYTLLGVAIGPGLGVRVFHGLSVFGELLLRAFPFGSDLPAGAALFHGDLTLGVRHAF